MDLASCLARVPDYTEFFTLDELRRIIRRIETRRPPQAAPEPIERVVGGELVDTGAGSLLVVRRVYPLTHRHGRVPLPGASTLYARLVGVRCASAGAAATSGGAGIEGVSNLPGALQAARMTPKKMMTAERMRQCTAASSEKKLRTGEGPPPGR